MTTQPAKIPPWSWALPLGLLLAARLALGAAYSLVIPTWEAYDEDGHFAYARYLAVYHRLLQPGDPRAEQVWERFQPPLYYLLIAPVIAAYNLGEHFQPPRLNPFLSNGDAGVNYALHPPQLDPAASQLAQAVLAARLVGVLVTTLGVLFVFQAAGRLWPGQPAAVWTATLLYAFWPQLLFNGSVISNDLLVVTLAAGVYDVCVLLLVDGFRPLRALVLAGLLAAALLTKINALALLPAAALALALSLAPVARRAGWRSPRLWFTLLTLAALVVAALALLNSLGFVTGQLLRAETLARFVANLPGGSQPAALGFAGLAAALGYGFRTYFASFGWGNLETFPVAYVLWAAAAALATLGLLLRLARGRRANPAAMPLPPVSLAALIVLGVVGAGLALVVADNNIYLLPGRYLLPSLPAVVVLLVEGWRALAGRARRLVWRAASLGLLLLAWLIPSQTLVPAYAQPNLARQQPAVVVDQNFGDALTLLGYDPLARLLPGQPADLTLCWQAPLPLAADYAVYLEVTGPDGQGYGRLVTYPGRGNYPTSFWPAGVPICDHYRVPVGADFPAPALGQVRVMLLTTPDLNGPQLSLLGADGRPTRALSVGIPLVVVQPAPPPPAAQAVRMDLRFGDALALTGYSLTPLPAKHAVQVDLRWQALRDLDASLVIFVHLRDTPTHAYAQGDGEPRGGWYPTEWWRKGDIVLDTHILPLPPGPSPALSLVLGVVARDANQRLPAFDSSGAELPDDEAVLEQNLTFPAQSSFALAPGAFQP